MKMISNKTALQLLLLHAASYGRGELLFGESLKRVEKILPDFVDLCGLSYFPDIYLEFPLQGDPFLDITVLYENIPENTKVASPLAEGTDQMMEWLSEVRKKYPDVCGGFEIDTKSPSLKSAAVHFQPREHTELAKEFCETIEEPHYGQLYEKMAGRMPKDRQPSYFGLFTGRPGSPLRIGGYMNQEQIKSCIDDPDILVRLFESAGFTAYDDQMIRQICSVLSVSPTAIDFQFDLYPDDVVGDSFAIGTSFAIEQPEAVRSAFFDHEGNGAKYMDLLQRWEIADDRWKKGLEAVFAGALPIGGGAVTFSVFPQWFKVRWTGKILQPAKMYLLAKSGVIDPKK